jgi:hypothetical protein
MDLKSQLYELSQRAPELAPKVSTEEATKHSFVLPFIRALGYNVFDPGEVVPEFTADIGEKKGEKVDYAILIEGKPILLFECKPCGEELDPQRAIQLQRYFHGVASVRFGVLTDGLTYQFYSDLERANVMDTRPFLEVSLLNLTDETLEQLRRFSKDSFNMDDIRGTAGALKYTREIRQLLEVEFESPSEDFLRFLTKRVYDGSFTKNTLAYFTPIVQKALRDFINGRITRTLEAARDLQAGTGTTEAAETPDAGNGLVTTTQEIQGYYIVKAILSLIVDLGRVYMRDLQSYCGILLDDNNRKPICRLYFHDPNKLRLGLFDAHKQEERVPIERLDDIYKYADRMQQIVRAYESQQKPPADRKEPLAG